MTPVMAFVGGAAVGAIIGSFLANLIIRWPRGQSVIRDRSACDQCEKVLRPLDLIPLLSFAIRRGRCAYCGGTIDPLHFMIELACAVIGGTAFMLAPSLEGVGWAVLGWGLLTLAVLDWRHYWLPDAITLPMIFLGLTLGIWTTDVALIDRVIGAIAGYATLLAISIGYRTLRGREGLGLGDAKLLAAIGAWFGWQALPFVLLLASIAAILVVLIFAWRGQRISATTQIPLGTFLCMAGVPGWAAMTVLTQGI